MQLRMIFPIGLIDSEDTGVAGDKKGDGVINSVGYKLASSQQQQRTINHFRRRCQLESLFVVAKLPMDFDGQYEHQYRLLLRRHHPHH
jgi:hypothetical protein